MSAASNNRFNLFVYGTLGNRDYFQILTGKPPQRKKAVLRDFERIALSNSFPYIMPKKGSLVEGYIIENINIKILEHLDKYEAEGTLYFRREVSVDVSGEKVRAFTYIGDPKKISAHFKEDIEPSDRVEDYLKSKIEEYVSVNITGIDDAEMRELEKKARRELLGETIKDLLSTYFRQPNLSSFIIKYNIEKFVLPTLDWIKDNKAVIPHAKHYLWLIVKQTIFNQLEDRIKEEFRGAVRLSNPYYAHTISSLAAMSLINPKTGPIKQIASALSIDEYNPMFNYIDYVVGAIFIADGIYNQKKAEKVIEWVNANRQPGSTPLGVEIELSCLGGKCIGAESNQDERYDCFYYFNDFDLAHRFWKVGGHVDDHKFGSGGKERTRGFLEIAFGRYKIAANLSTPVTNDPWLLSQLIIQTTRFYEVKPHSLHISIQIEKDKPFTKIKKPSFLLCLLLLGGDINLDEKSILREKRIFQREIIDKYTSLNFSRINEHKQYEDDKDPNIVVEFQFPRLFREHSYEPLIMALKGYQLASNPMPLHHRDSPYQEYHREIEKALIEWAEHPKAIPKEDIEEFVDEVRHGLLYEQRKWGGHSIEYIDSSIDSIKDILSRYNNYLKWEGKKRLE